MKFYTTYLIIVLFCLAFVSSSNAQTNNSSQSQANKQKDRPVKITKKPQISNDVFDKCLKDSRNTSLLVELKVTFENSGQISGIVVSQASGCEYFDKEALKAAKKIKFKPAIKDGQPVTVTKPVEYRAGIY